ncbi:MAG: hypothetical protein LBS83_01955 [Holosporales bacterium]|nr:hypothetical protein [Holosporales bacterium]
MDIFYLYFSENLVKTLYLYSPDFSIIPKIFFHDLGSSIFEKKSKKYILKLSYDFHFKKNCKLAESILKPQKITDSNFLGFKDWQQLKSAFFWGPQYIVFVRRFCL